MEVSSIYYNSKDGTFEDDFGSVSYDISNLMPHKDIMRYKQMGGMYYAKTYNPDVTYEIEFTTNEHCQILIYYPEENLIRDEEDEIIFNIFSLITPNELMLFKKNKETLIINPPNGGNVELIYLGDDVDA